jgi:hypothetical protein
MALKFRRGTTAQKSGSLAFGEPYVNTTLGTLQIGLDNGDVTLSALGTGSNISVAGISGSSLNITGNAKVDGNLTLGGQLTIGDATSDTVNVVASLSSSLIPSETNVFDLGSATKIWRDLYISTGSIKLVNPTTNTVVSTISTNADGTTTFDGLVRANQGIFIPNSVQVSGTGGLGIGAYGDRLMLGTSGSAGIGQQSLIFTDTNTHAYTFPSADGTIALTSDLTSGTNSVSALNSFTASQNTKNSTLSTYTASLDTKHTTLASVTASLNSYTSSLNNAIQLTGSTVSFLGNIVVYGTQSIINSENLAVADNLIYLNNESTITNPDLGVVGNYNDGVYAHAGIFRDASDGGAWKVFEGYTAEPSGTIDTTGNGFALADFKADVITATSFNGTINATNGIVSGSSQITAGSTTNFATDVKTQLNSNTVVSGSSQIDATATTNWSTGIKTQLNSNTVVSGSSQVTLSSTTGGSTTSDVRFGSLGIGMAASGTAGRIDASGDIVAYSTSDRNFKENITPIPNALEKISKISGNTYDWKVELKDVHGFEGNDVGVIAQEIEEVLPQLVTTRETGYKAVKYDKLVALLIEGIKEQQTQIHNLTLEVENLKKQKGL